MKIPFIIRQSNPQITLVCFFFLLFFSIDVAHTQQGFRGTDLNATYAQEEFRIGVQAYNRFAFNEAILSFERALAFKPGEPRLLDWLGRAYYRSGLEETAIRQWRSAISGYSPMSNEALLLTSKIETVRNRRSLIPFVEEGVRYVESGRFPGILNNQTFYRHPTGVLPLEDGTAWVVAYGTNELLRIDVNGLIRQRQRGPINGFDRPYDIVRGIDGKLFVSELNGGRISVLNSNGEWQYYIGSKGQGDGKFVGPQNLTIDSAGYLYVVDYGTRRISKYDPDGTFILSFGTRVPGFQGFLSPTGIAARNNRIYIADNISKQIYVFDSNGMYLGILIREGLNGPESLKFLSDGRLLVADTNRIIIVDVDSANIQELGLAGNSSVRVVSAAMDRNGSIITANFQGNEVAVMTRFSDMASGLFVQIDRVIAERFPLVTVEISVHDRLRRPIVGLDARNFLLTENGRTVSEQRFLGAGYRAQSGDISILMERSNDTIGLQDDLVVAMRDIANNFSGQVVSVVSAGEQPTKERITGGIALAARGNTASYTPRWRFDLGLRLSATDLLPAEKKRAVVFVGSGALGELAFDHYSLAELEAYLANNGIVFHAIIVGGGRADEKVQYLARQTGGEVVALYRPEGIGQLIRNIATYPNGSYILSYRSLLPTDFGRAYLPIEVEVYLMERSGRDMIGYFPPLE